jgi:glucose/arabinose dehydrogenase
MRVGRICVLSFALTAALASSLQTQAASAQALSCHGTQRARQVAELLFGRDIGNRLGVSERAWARFVAREITPRFPDGFTVTEASGQWRDSADGKIVREPSKRVEIVLPVAHDDDARLDAVVGAYKRQFHQQSVAVIVRPACVSF